MFGLGKIYSISFITYILGLLCIVLLLTSVFHTGNDELVIFPSDRELICRPYNDNTDSSGLSVCSLLSRTPNAIVFSYTLREHPATRKNNYAGLAIDWGSDSTCNNFIDISKYDKFIIQIGTVNAQWFKIHLKTWIDSVTRCSDFKTYYYEVLEEPFNNKNLDYTMLLKDFTRPDMTNECIDNYKLPKNLYPNRKKLFSIDIQSGTKEGNYSNRQSGVFSITKIAFSKNSFFVSNITLVFIILFLYFLLGYFLILPLIKHKYPSVSDPSVSDPSVSDPSVSVPSVSVPSVSVPSVSVPSISVPSISVPSISVPSISTTNKYSDKINTAIKMMERDYKVSNKAIRRAINIDSLYGDSVFSRKFKDEVGISPSEYKSFVLAKIIIKENSNISPIELYKHVNERLHSRDKLNNSGSLENIFMCILQKSISAYIQSLS